MPVSTSSRSTSPARLVFQSILALPFAALSVALAYRAVWTIVSALTMQAWPTVPATLQSVELLLENRASARASATYTYSLNGQKFTGKRVSLYGADNIGSFQRQADKELQGYFERHAPYPVHVNPKAPNESILMPVLRWEAIAFYLIFIVVFGGAGWGLLISSFFRYIKYRTEKALVAQYPNEPWRWRMEWSANRIKSSESSDAISAVFIAVFWNSFSWPMLLALPEKLKAGEYMGLLLLIFPLIGIFIAKWATVSVARARRFGETYLVLDTFPARPGEPLRGRVYAPAALDDFKEANFTLSCERNHRVSSSANHGASIRTTTVWETKAVSPVLRGQSESGGLLMNVNFTLPDTLPDSSSQSYEEWHTWQLAGKADLKGADFEAGFELPVFKR